MAKHANHVVVPLDGSKNAENAIPVAARVAAIYQAPVCVVHVLDEHAVHGEAEVATAKERFAAYAQETAERHGLGRFGCDVEVLTGPAAARILEESAGARFIAIASHGRSGLKATFVGSVADKVVRGATVPVLFVPALDPGVELGSQPVIIGVDGSPEAEQGLALGRELAKGLGARVILVRAYSLPPPVGVEFGYYQPDLIESLREGAEEYLASIAQPGEQTLVGLGSAAMAIEEAANQFDAGLVVLTSHGKNVAARIALGSTTDRVMHSMRRPLLIVPVHATS
jgi:nucleotide-binding universal stress UspA family protein